jgi:hypothetical protein
MDLFLGGLVLLAALGIHSNSGVFRLRHLPQGSLLALPEALKVIELFEVVIAAFLRDAVEVHQRVRQLLGYFCGGLML